MLEFIWIIPFVDDDSSHHIHIPHPIGVLRKITLPKEFQAAHHDDGSCGTRGVSVGWQP